MPNELRNLTVKKIALVRKGYKPKNSGATIEIVKAQEEPVSQIQGEQLSLTDRMVKALQSVFAPATPPATEPPAATPVAKADETPAEAPVGGEATPSPAASTEPDAAETPATEDPATPTESTDDVEKAKMAKQQVTDQGEHGEMIGMHAHEHTHHDYANGGTYTHSHEHVHSGSADHSHDFRPGHDGPDPMAKAQLELSAKVDALLARLDGGEFVTKAALGEEKVGEIVAAALATALEPVAKALEDIGIEKARLPLTPAVTQTIAPNREPAAKVAEKAEAVKSMSFPDALRTLLHS